MPSFKDMLNTDIVQAFFHNEEFAEKVTIDGNLMEVIIDDDQLQKHNLKSGGEGLAVGELLFYAKKADFSEEPFIGKRMKFNKKRYEIKDISENLGVYTITLVGYRS